MNLADIRSLKGRADLPFSVRAKKGRAGELIINNKTALPIEKVASYFKTHSDISLINLLGIEVGVLCFTKSLGIVSKSQLTESQFIAFLTECALSDYEGDYKFSYDYVVIDEKFHEEYVASFQSTAPLWGGYFHSNLSILNSTYTKDVKAIRMTSVKVGNKIFEENLARAVAQPFAFERFLKLYHLLELRFDYDVVKKIKALNIETDAKEIGRLLGEYSTKEIARLTDILNDHCKHIPPIVAKLNALRSFPNIAIDIFYKFGGKDSNPFKEEAKLLSSISRGFEEVNFPNLKSSDYRVFIIKLTAFWIYRVRCSIAHNKIGEYILSMDQEDFIVEFAEPLLIEVLKQCFKA